MLPYIKADLYRLYHKKSIRVFLAALSLLYIALYVFLYVIYDDFFEIVGTTYVASGYNMLLGNGMLLPFIGVQSYLVVFTNDLSSKIFSGLFSTGLSKRQFLLAKVIVFTVYYWVVMVILGLAYFGLWLVFSTQTSIVGGSEEIIRLFLMSGVLYIGILGYAFISNIYAHYSQSSGPAIFAYFLIGMGLLYQLISTLSLMISALEPISEVLFTQQFLDAQQAISTGMDFPINELGIMIVYVFIAMGLNWCVLNRVEIE